MPKSSSPFAPAFETPPEGRPKTPAPQQPLPGAVNNVAQKVSNIMKRADASKLAVQKTGTRLMHSAETLGTLFIASAAEGFLGQEKLKLGGIDLRAPIGLAAEAWGAYQLLSGQDVGEHAVAFGDGFTGSWLCSLGRDAGQALREKREGKSTPAAPIAPAPSSGGAFRGEEPLVTVPLEPFPMPNESYLPQPTQVGYQPQPWQIPDYRRPIPDFPFQGPQLMPVQDFGYRPPPASYQPPPGAYQNLHGYFQNQPAQRPPYYPQPAGLLAEPTPPMMAGPLRELMPTPETQAPQALPQMIVTPPTPPPELPAMRLTPPATPPEFQGPPRMRLTPPARPVLEHLRQRMGQAQEPYPQGADNPPPVAEQPQMSQEPAPTLAEAAPGEGASYAGDGPSPGAQLAGYEQGGEGFAGPGRRFQPAQMRRFSRSRFPSSAESPEVETF